MNSQASLSLVQLYLKNEHYYSYEVVTYKKCDMCGRRLKSNNMEHVCSKEMAAFYAARVTGMKKYVSMKKLYLQVNAYL